MRKVLFGLAILLAVIPGTSRATTLTAADVLARARVYLRDQSTSPNRQQFPDATLLQFLSDGQREANAQNWLLQTSIPLTLVGGTSEYAMPDDFMSTMRVWFQPVGGSYIKLNQSSMDQLDAQSAGWTAATGSPTAYYIDRSGDSLQLGFYPVPTTVSTGPVVVYYVQNSVDLTSTASIPFNGQLILQPYVSALAYYVAYRGFMSVEETDLAGAYLQYWVGFMQLMRQGTTKMPDFNPGFVGQHGSP